MSEPLWRQVLNWGCVTYFLALPALALILGFTHFHFDSPGITTFLREFHFAVTAIVAAIAGLNSFDRRSETKANGKPAEVDSGKTRI